MVTAIHSVTADDLLRMPDGKSYELVGGELVPRHSCALSSYVNSELTARLANVVVENRAGWVFGSRNGYQCFPGDPDRVRRPSVSFVSRSRLAAAEIDHGWTRIAPDLAVLKVAPDDSATGTAARLVDYLEVGVPIVWVIDPFARTAFVHSRDRGNAHLTGDVELVGEGPLEGFRVKLADLLPRD